jgi:hypothetical protein
MKPFGTCCFCGIVVGKYQYTDIDEPFASNGEFVAVASIGALVEGWSLIIPKTHQLSMRNIYGRSVFADFVRSVLPPLVHRYGPLIAFEHGANKEGSITACGTNHAHLHLVPLGESLLPEIQNSGLQWAQCHASKIASQAGENEYLFYSELYDKEVWQDPVGYLHVLEHPVSQFFRRLIAKRRGRAEVSDYRRFPHLDTARQTRKVLVGSVA